MTVSLKTACLNSFSYGSCDFLLEFHWNFTPGSNSQNAGIGADKALVPKMRQAIIFTNKNLLRLRIYTSLDHEELGL